MGKRDVSTTSDDNDIWVLTSEVNDYDQHGAYFERVFRGKPTIEKLAPIMEELGYISNEQIGTAIAKLQYILDGGGRQGVENTWYNLNKVVPL